MCVHTLMVASGRHEQSTEYNKIAKRLLGGIEKNPSVFCIFILYSLIAFLLVLSLFMYSIIFETSLMSH